MGLSDFEALSLNSSSFFHSLIPNFFLCDSQVHAFIEEIACAIYEQSGIMYALLNAT